MTTNEVVGRIVISVVIFVVSLFCGIWINIESQIAVTTALIAGIYLFFPKEVTIDDSSDS